MSRNTKNEVVEKVVTRKARAKRGDLGIATGKRLLMSGASFENNGRVSKDAVIYALDLVTAFIQEVADNCAGIVGTSDRVTVKKPVILEVLKRLGPSHGIKLSDIAVPVKSEFKHTLPIVGVVRIFRSKIGTYRVSTDTKHIMVSAAEAYLRYLGHGAGKFAKRAKRCTIMMDDIKELLP